MTEPSAIADRLLGAWSLHSLRRLRNDVFYRYPMGETATGRLLYSSSGYMSAFLMSAQWPQGKGSITATNMEFLSYSGRWRVASSGTIVHNVDVASATAFIGRPLVRHFSFTPEGSLLLRTETHTLASGAKSHDELIWLPAK
jgi:hypothetical protein